MNKFKHLTPSNIAPLGKRNPIQKGDYFCYKLKFISPVFLLYLFLILSEKIEKLQSDNSDKINELSVQNSNQLQQQQTQNQTVQDHQQNQQHSQAHVTTSQQQLNWSCELCGRMFSTRDEWTLHAKSHLEDKMLLQNQQNQVLNHNHSINLNTNAVVTNNLTHNNTLVQPSNAAAYFPTHNNLMSHYNMGERHFCLMCRQDFTNKTEFMLHVRGHFEGKVTDLTAADMLARSLMDNSGLCT